MALEVLACPKCGILWGNHTRRPDGRAWDESYVPDHFAQALRMRRELQAATITDLLAATILAGTNGKGKVLDYGFGQGVFLAHAVARGIDAYGCDLDVNAPLNVAPKDRRIQLSEPWGFPAGEWQTVVMLDVIEHHDDPVSFLSKLKCEYVLLKVPNATGPAARAAMLGASTGRVGLLEQLFLVGENFPHRWLATKRGLRAIAERSGFDVVVEKTITEVGAELPNRMREKAGFVKSAVLKAAGIALGAIGSLWSDASIVVLQRKPS